MKRAVDWHCAGCGTQVTIPIQLGKRVKDREKYCTKCARKIKEGNNGSK